MQRFRTGLARRDRDAQHAIRGERLSLPWPTHGQPDMLPAHAHGCQNLVIGLVRNQNGMTQVMIGMRLDPLVLCQSTHHSQT